jgi:hypothetical protein
MFDDSFFREAVMPDLPTQDLRSNLATYAVPVCRAPAVAGAMLESLPREPYDPDFVGQSLATTYFDTAGLDLRKARRRGEKYLTLRVRCYRPAAGAGSARRQGPTYALSVKTEGRKFRAEIPPALAEAVLSGAIYFPGRLSGLLPADLQARLWELTDGQPLNPVVTVCARRYAVEDDQDRLTLDLDIATDTGKCLPTGILEFKSAQEGRPPPDPLAALGLRPIKVSKFLWSTLWR